MSRFYVEARLRGDPGDFRPIPVVFGAGRWDVDDARQAEAEVRLWSRTTFGQRHEFRVRAAQPLAKEKPARVVANAKERLAEEAAARDAAANPANLKRALKHARANAPRA